MLLPIAVQAADDDNLQLGHIEFDTSIQGEAREKFLDGVMALHSFWYEKARDLFVESQQLEPAFGMAYWGEAMSFDNALGVVAGIDFEARGEAVVEKMVALDEAGSLTWSDYERAYYQAVRERFAVGASINDKRRNYGQAMERLTDRFPDDDEAQVFATLALMSFAGFDREQASHVVLAAAPLEEIYERNPDHPGVLHYLIHAYDTQDFALLGLRQARRFGTVAASAPHAVHMPSHIYKHLGMWNDVIRVNQQSWEVSVQWQEQENKPLHMRDFHTFSWLLDGYLSIGLFDEAEELMTLLDNIQEEIRSRGEDPGHFPETASNLRLMFVDTPRP